MTSNTKELLRRADAWKWTDENGITLRLIRDMKDYIASMGDGWRSDMENAPRDRKILLWALTNSETGNYQTEVCSWNDVNKCWFWWNGNTEPTHWQPLPQPPENS